MHSTFTLDIPKALRSLLTLLLLLSALPASAQPPAVDVQHYAFALELTDQSNVISGEAAVTVRFTSDETGSFNLDLIGPNPGMRVSRVSSEEIDVEFSHERDRLSITVSPPAHADEERTYTIRYEGEPADGLVISTNKFGDRTFFGDNWPNRARNWLPTVDHPSDKATVEFVVTAPDHYQVVGNGYLVEETDMDRERRRTHWRTDVPIPTKITVIGVARFAIQHTGAYKGIPVEAWVYPQDREAGFYDFSVATDMLAYFERKIGPYPYEKLANVQSTTRYGGMENASNIFYDEDEISGQQGNKSTVAHEIAHQWFGDSVTEADWAHIWLSEGFATYFAQLYMEAAYGRDRLVEGMQAARKRVLDFHERRPNAPIINPAITDPNQHLNANSYQKGAWVLHMLRHAVGDDNFWAGIRAYYESFRDGNATSEDLQKKMEEASGQDLDAFFEQWLYRPGQPMIKGSWSYDAGRKSLEVRLVQSQDASFVFPIEIGIDAGGKFRVETVFVDSKEASFSFAVDAAPARVVLDPNTWLLAEMEMN